MEDIDVQAVKKELIETITYFVQRQELVAQALKEFGLDLNIMGILGAIGWTLGSEGAKEFFTVSTTKLEGDFINALQKMAESNIPSVKQTGQWTDKNGDIWNYFMHGGGCRLTNKKTDELIDWDCPNPTHFDAFKFCYHLKWQTKNFPNKYPHLIKYLHEHDIYTIEHKLIPELVNDGKIIKTLGNPYSLA
ncbi:MAG TPA: hypothetical protein VJ972_13125 [Anaerolineales bacterium]|nr:hypothetical protein [Anaerolineales bacterium]